MKKTLLLGIVGLAFGSATTNAQSTFEFGSYLASTFYGTPITYNGDALGADFSATLFYSLDSGATWSQVTGTGSVVPFLGVTGGDPNTTGAGYFVGGYPNIAADVGTVVQAYVAAFNNAAVGGFAVGEITGQSLPFSFTTADPSGSTFPNLGNTTFTGFTVTADVIPEPSTFALAGLGLAGLLIFRRRK